jgi:glycine/D-amino acid oxidase-like deaminating enzyme
MKTYDWIIIGGGITGSCLAYELSQHNFKVLLLEKDAIADNATVYSYGGLAYWSGTNELTHQLCSEGIELHRQLSAELDSDTEFRELDLVLTIDREADPATIAQNYQHFGIIPELLPVRDACELEPLLNPNAISGVLKLPHGHIQPQKTTIAYQQALLRNGGKIAYETVIDLSSNENKITGVKTANNIYHADRVVVCAGGMSRSLLQQTGITVNNYFTHAQLIITEPVDIQLRTLVMPAVQNRFTLEATTDLNWDIVNDTIHRSILDIGAIQFLDGSLCLGQISFMMSDPHTGWDTIAAETAIRKGIERILPSLSQIPGNCRHCIVAFNRETVGLVGKLQPTDNLYLFSGFTSTLVFAPILARRFAAWIVGNKDDIIETLQSTINNE